MKVYKMFIRTEDEDNRDVDVYCFSSLTKAKEYFDNLAQTYRKAAKANADNVIIEKDNESQFFYKTKSGEYVQIEIIKEYIDQQLGVFLHPDSFFKEMFGEGGENKINNSTISHVWPGHEEEI